MRVLGVAPAFDEASQYSYKWYERLREEVKGKAEVKELLRDEATRKRFEDEVEEYGPDAVVFYDHGSEDCLCAQECKECVLDLRNVDKVAGKIIYTMACLSARRLGAKAYARGCVYVGYVEEFVFTTYDEELFSRAANSGFIAYVNGVRDWGRIKEIMVEEFSKAMEEARDPWSKMWLQWDRDSLRVYGPGADVPESKCLLRRLALKILGPRAGWRVKRRHALSLLLLGAGIGVYVHDRICEWHTLGERLHGLDIGFSLTVISWILVSFEFVKWLRKT
jgi:hypothetical protein